MSLVDWIKMVGNKEAAKRLGVSERTVESYRQGRRKPKPGRVLDIAKLTGSKVSFKECF
jgi:DNA-binding transcriptional regulator YdaS (Cro superfamily)